jgi:hypothetical protein
MRRVTSKFAIARDFFLVKMYVWQPGAARRQPGAARPRWGSLNALQDTLAAVSAMEGDTLQPQLGCFSARNVGGWKYVEGAEMNEKRYFQIRQRFRLRVKMHVWRPGFARTR